MMRITDFLITRDTIYLRTCVFSLLFRSLSEGDWWMVCSSSCFFFLSFLRRVVDWPIKMTVLRNDVMRFPVCSRSTVKLWLWNFGEIFGQTFANYLQLFRIVVVQFLMFSVFSTRRVTNFECEIHWKNSNITDLSSSSNLKIMKNE